MTIAGSTLLVTGANRGIGRALVEAALSRGAARVYAGVRQAWTHPDPRVVGVRMDVTDARQIQEAAADVGHLDTVRQLAPRESTRDLDAEPVVGEEDVADPRHKNPIHCTASISSGRK